MERVLQKMEKVLGKLSRPKNFADAETMTEEKPTDDGRLMKVAREWYASAIKSVGAASSDASISKSCNVQLCSVTLEHCMSFLSASELALAARVCKFWNECSSSDPVWLPYVLKSKTVPDAAFSNSKMCAMQRNLLLNPAAEEDDRYWTRNGNGSLIIETSGEGGANGVNPFPNGATKCWTASHDYDGRTQTIDLCGDRLHLDRKFLDSRPGLELSFYMAARFDQSVVMKGFVTLLDKDRQPMLRCNFDHAVSASLNWRYVVKDVGGPGGLPEGVRHVIFSWQGKDTSWWAGHYGAKITSIALRLRPPGYAIPTQDLQLE